MKVFVLLAATEDTKPKLKLFFFVVLEVKFFLKSELSCLFSLTEEKGSKHRKHRAPVCRADQIQDDITLARGKRAGNFTNIGDVGDFEMCIKRCCQQNLCDVAYKSAETCFLVHCFSRDSCQTTASLTDFFSPKLCFVKRNLKEEEEDGICFSFFCFIEECVLSS